MRVRVIRKLAVAAALLIAATVSVPAEMGPAIDRDQALARLRDGNARFVAGEPQAWNCGPERRKELAATGQQPIACIVTCSDARVSPELVFDQSLGDLFVVRLAGNVVTTEAAASVEYAVEHLHVPVVVVLGHTQCDAVKAALDADDAPPTGPMGSARVKSIGPLSMRMHGWERRNCCETRACLRRPLPRGA
jgi:carbonic anhydrase